MYKPLKSAGIAMGLLAVLAVGCAREEEIDEDASQPAEMPAPAPSDVTTPAGPAEPVTSSLEARNDSGITGEVTATHTASDVTVQITLNGAKEGVSYPAHIHTGTCECGGPVAVELTPVTAGQSSTTVEAAKLPANQPAFVQIHDASNNPVACSDLKGHGAEASGTRTY